MRKTSWPVALVCGVTAIGASTSTGVMYLHPHTKKVVVKEQVQVEKPVYVLSPDGKTGAPSTESGGSYGHPSNGVDGDEGKLPKTGVKLLTQWNYTSPGQDGSGFQIVEIDGQRCTLWVWDNSAMAKSSGMSCRPIPLK